MNLKIVLTLIWNNFFEILRSGGKGGNPNLPEIVSVDGAAAFPLGIGLPERYITRRVVLVGDACHRVHPLAGLGVNLGYGDAECLVAKLEENIMQGDIFGSYGYLCEYETERSRHNLPTALTIDGIQKLYSTNLDLVVLARSLGVQVSYLLYDLKCFFSINQKIMYYVKESNKFKHSGIVSLLIIQNCYH